MSTPQRTYTLSIAAHNHLNKLFAQPTRSTEYRRQQVPMFDGFTVVHVSDTAIGRENVEGLSHALCMMSQSYDIDDWQDTRPEVIKRSHLNELVPIPLEVYGSIATYKEYLKTYSQPAHKVRWYDFVPPDYLQSIEDDDREWEELSWSEQETREHYQELQRKQFALRLDDFAREYYYFLARHWYMQPLSRVYNQTAYIAAALEAIGTGWLQPPDDYKEVLAKLPNRNKRRIINNKHERRQRGKLFGNFDGSAWVPDLDMMEQLGYKDIADKIRARLEAAKNVQVQE